MSKRSLTELILENPLLLGTGPGLPRTDPKIDALLQQLRSSSSAERLKAVRELGAYQPPTLHVFAALGIALRCDGDPTVRAEARAQLERAGVDPTDALSFADDTIRRNAPRKG